MSIIERKGKKGVKYQVNFRYKYHGISKRYIKTFDNKIDAINHETIMKAKLINGSNDIKASKMTIRDIFNEFMDVCSKSYSQNTLYDTEKYFSNRIIPEIGNLNISMFDYNDAQSFFNKFSDKGYESNKSMKKAMNRVFDFAVKNGYMNSNPVKLVDVVGEKDSFVNNASKEEKVINIDDFKNLLISLKAKGSEQRYDCVRYDSYIIALEIGWYLGLRISETLALNKNDFNFNEKTVVINKQIIYKQRKTKDIDVTKILKTDASYAILPIPDELIFYLKEWFDKDRESLKLCHDKNDNYLSPDVFSMQLKRIISSTKECKNLKHFTYHCLRHTLATRLAEMNTSPTDTAFIMRHSSFDVTMANYIHKNNDRLKDIINNVNKGTKVGDNI